jgi:bifunctional UDP-N-acetylglucosamine pyrophosphorylase / glucosamine-1-phosphate N-acetyltransferase
MPITVIILAAGQGKRMRSDLPKVLQPLAGRPLLDHVLTGASALKPREIRIVHGHGGEQVRSAFPGPRLRWFHQAEQRGTGHAVKQALPKLPPGDVALILYGDVPLVRPATLKRLVARAARGELAVLTTEMQDPRATAGFSGASGAPSPPSWRKRTPPLPSAACGRSTRA